MDPGRRIPLVRRSEMFRWVGGPVCARAISCRKALSGGGFAVDGLCHASPVGISGWPCRRQAGQFGAICSFRGVESCLEDLWSYRRGGASVKRGGTLCAFFGLTWGCKGLSRGSWCRASVGGGDQIGMNRCDLVGGLEFQVGGVVSLGMRAITLCWRVFHTA